MRGWKVVVLMAVVLLVGCSGAPSGGGDRLQIAGSTSLQPLTEVLAEEYARAGGGRISTQGGGSTAGIQAVLTGAAQVGAVSRPLSRDESAAGLVEHIIGYDVLTVIAHPTNPVDSLSVSQLRAMFAGTVGDWAAVGGGQGVVHVITREAGSGSREAFRSLVGPVSKPGAIVQNSSGAIRVAVMDDPQAIGYVSLGVARMGGVRLLAVDGHAPGEPGYRLIRPLALVTRGQPAGAAAAFIRFVRSPAGQRLVEEEGLVPVGP